MSSDIDPTTGKRDENSLICTDLSILRQVSLDTTQEEIERHGYADKMYEAGESAWCDWVGICAIQIGVPLRFAFHFVHADEKEKNGYRIDKESPVFLLNPKIIKALHVAQFPKESCLSMPNVFANTWRYTDLIYSTVEDGKEVTKTAVGFEAVVIQHEIGHMNGELCIDHTSKPYVPGRNEPCSCGSGKKFKKCCEGDQYRRLTKVMQPAQPNINDLKKAVIKP